MSFWIFMVVMVWSCENHQSINRGWAMLGPCLYHHSSFNELWVLKEKINTEHFRTIYIYYVQPLQTIVLISINYRKPLSNIVGHVYKNMCDHGYSCFVFDWKESDFEIVENQIPWITMKDHAGSWPWFVMVRHGISSWKIFDFLNSEPIVPPNISLLVRKSKEDGFYKIKYHE